MKANVYSMLEECQEGCSLVDPSAEAVVARKRSADTKLNVIIDCLSTAQCAKCGRN